MNNLEFKSFFKIHAANVDNANRQGFWRLTDELIETFLIEAMPKKTAVTLVDFGGGTGRWLEIMDRHLDDSNLILVDMSEDMLAKAKQRISQGGFKNKVHLIHGNIESIGEIESESVDYVISTYNPLSFTDEPSAVIKEAHRILMVGGTACITVQGYYNAIYSKLNNALAEADELKSIFEQKKVTWNPSVPGLWQLSRTDMEKIFKDSGFSKIFSRGIATVTQPQAEDFDPTNVQIGQLSEKLNNDQAFHDVVLGIELAAGRDQSAVDRSMNIMTIGIK